MNHVILATVLLLLLRSLSKTEATAQVVPLQSRITQVQPMSGIVLWNDHEKVDTDAVQLEFRYCGYDEIVTADGQYDFTALDRILDAIAARNHQAILRFRFVYPGRDTTVPEWIRGSPGYTETIGKSEGKRTAFCDWSHPKLRQFTLDFYSRFARRYDKDPRIAFLQVGFGLWAEYHIYDGPRKLGSTFPDKAYQATLLKHMDDCFDSLPWSISVDAADSEYSPLEGNADLLSLGFGVFDDSFLCEPHPRENAVNWRILGGDRWRRSSAGGEFSYYTKRDQRLALSKSGPNGVSFAEAAKRFHISYMIGNDQPRYQSMQRIKAASMRCGYKFRVLRAEHRDETLTLRVTNDGIAPIYRDAFFAVGDRRSDQSLKGLQAGEERIFEISRVDRRQAGSVRIVSDFILPGQSIQFAAGK
ncbi:MAG: beta-galactosidase [Planctomycetota bacterium]